MSPAVPIKQRFPGPGVLGVAQPQSQSRVLTTPLESYQSCGVVISPVKFRRGILGSHLGGESPMVIGCESHNESPLPPLYMYI
jgi:hypothetical protein